MFILLFVIIFLLFELCNRNRDVDVWIFKLVEEEVFGYLNLLKLIYFNLIVEDLLCIKYFIKL